MASMTTRNSERVSILIAGDSGQVIEQFAEVQIDSPEAQESEFLDGENSSTNIISYGFSNLLDYLTEFIDDGLL